MDIISLILTDLNGKLLSSYGQYRHQRDTQKTPRRTSESARNPPRQSTAESLSGKSDGLYLTSMEIAARADAEAAECFREFREKLELAETERQPEQMEM